MEDYNVLEEERILMLLLLVGRGRFLVFTATSRDMTDQLRGALVTGMFVCLFALTYHCGTFT